MFNIPIIKLNIRSSWTKVYRFCNPSTKFKYAMQSNLLTFHNFV